MADDSWYGQLARWLIGGAFWTGVALGGIGAFGIYKYKQRAEEKANEALKELPLDEVVHDEGTRTAKFGPSSVKPENPLDTAKTVEVSAEAAQQSMITQDVGSLDHGSLVNRTIVPLSPTHSDDSETTLTQEEDVSTILNSSRILMSELNEALEELEENEREQKAQLANSDLEDWVEVTKDSSELVRKLAEAAQDTVTSTHETRPAESSG